MPEHDRKVRTAEPQSDYQRERRRRDELESIEPLILSKWHRAEVSLPHLWSDGESRLQVVLTPEYGRPRPEITVTVEEALQLARWLRQAAKAIHDAQRRYVS